ncbi:hypothetical protein BX600DRAFT_208533 [Xylariales sp. PMI_506]|nr:hypothetical protein BX600DRAFT_208533 [Xylariales sp. PMI_506]
MAAAPPAPLTDEEKEYFLKYGYIHLTNCFTRMQAAEVTKDVWTRLGMSPTDRLTWDRARIHMPSHRTFDCAQFAPRAWAAICELCGGEERIDAAASRSWRDSLIVNLGTEEGAGRPPVPPRELDNWHVDGDFFVHYLDSPEQALLVIPLFSDIEPAGGGTMLCPDAIPKVARWLFEHPEGVSPRMVPRGHEDFGRERNLAWYNALTRSCDEFVEATGRVGDVYLMHPLMLHSASNNALRKPRMITNPPVSLKQPHYFERANGQYSLVELKTIRSLGGENVLKGWNITRPREAVIPERLRIQATMKEDEKKRLEDAGKIAISV